MRVVYSVHNFQDVFLGSDDAGQTEDWPCRIIWMNRHVDVVLIAYRHDAVEEVDQVFAQSFFVNVFVFFEEILNDCHTFWFPAWHNGSVHVAGYGFKHFFRVQVVYSFLGVSENR